ncbi:S9 family peptidase [Neorhodopirellula pilleata]|uniref:Prolyl tripeptidyl peptidase n=1 Tax=Neorhodopirellula pilleata TaxID=2714738 RepID=A0A5C6AQB7_9BACT|nr:DPP IV N-terminal domain-containing protein [Neorhodopirellula pilleata]TWU01641.1 Prolyl tripeptidyl peptidase precursor [Neorhodopirellula pilleata]
MIRILFSSSVFVLLMILCAHSDLSAEPLPKAWVDGTTLARLKSVYERNEFRPDPFQARWLPDSSGYSVEQTDPSNGRSTTVHFNVETAKPFDPQRTVEQPSNSRRLVSPDGKYKIEFQDRDVFVRSLETDKLAQLTHRTPDRDISFRGLSWCADGKHVSVIEVDQTLVKQRSMLVPEDPSYPAVREQRFARVGGKIAAHRVGIVNVESSKCEWLPLESPDEGFYLGTVEWAGGTDELLIERLSRSRDVREFFLAKPDGEMKRIFHESDPAWVVASQAKNSGLVWIRDGNEFIVISEKDGWRHAYRYSRAGKELSLLTPGNYDIIDRATVDETNRWYYFYASPENATERYLYRVSLDGSGKPQRITPPNQPGTHDYDFSPDAKWAFHTVSTFDTPPIVELIEVAGHRTVAVVRSNEELHQLARSVVHHPTEFVQLDIGNDISLDAWMMKPKDFDETKQYPVFIYVYGEPHSQTVLNSWGAGQSHFLRAVADLGYLVVSIDNRGTPAPKGAAWRRAIFGSLGPLSTEEQAAGLKELARMRPFVDLSRVGIWGWSGGGSNTLNAMFRQPDVYHVGIAVVPKPQPHLYNAWFQEIYMRTRETNPGGYQRSAPIHYAEGLKGKLLIVTGSGETNTHIQIIEGLVDRLIELGKPFDYMVYPNRDHGLQEGTGTLIHVRMLITRYLLQNLPPGPRTKEASDAH